MFFKLFQLMLRWFPSFRSSIEKERTKNASLNRRAFNKYFSGIPRDLDQKGSILAPYHVPYMQNSTHSVIRLATPVDTRGTVFQKYRVLQLKVTFDYHANYLLGRSTIRTSSPSSSDQVQELQKRVGHFFLFQGDRDKYLLLDIYPSLDKKSCTLVFLETLGLSTSEKAMASEFSCVLNQTIQWELGAIRRKDLPVTHMLREREVGISLKTIKARANAPTVL